MLDYKVVSLVEDKLGEVQDQREIDAMIKYLIQEADFEIAYYLVCTYITKRNVMDLHKSIISNISNSKSTLDLAPRGFGKSTVGDVDYCITRILRDPNIRIMIGSKTQTQAEAFLKEVRTHFEQNEDLIRIFGDWKTSKDNVWNDREFTVNKRSIIKKEATLTALGASGAVISKHFDVIIGDDLVGLENARTEKQRSNLKEWFYSSLFPTLEPDGEIHILGTRYNPLDLYEDLIKSKDYVVNTQRAIRVVNGKKVSLWEEKFSLERLEAILKQSGKIIFNMQYQNDTELAKGKIFKAQYFRYYEEYKIDYDFQTAKVRVKTEDGIDQWIKVRLCFGCDLAISEKEQDKGDYFVLMVIGVDADHNVYVLDYVKEGIPQITDRINKGIDTARYNAERVARTETKRVTYCAHDDVYKDTEVEELRYRCANGGDSRTCQYCRADNGKVFKRGEEPTLPRHPNCRCVYIPVVSDTFEDNELNELTGSVRGAENYEKWREAEAKKQEEVKPVEKVNTKTVEKELKENPTPVPEQIKLTDYPQAFYATKPEAKNTQALLDYMNSKTSTDPNVVALYTKMDKLCDGLSDEVVLKVTHGEHRVKRSWNKNFDYVVDVGIPKINPNYIGTYDTNLHEEMHFLDMLITVKDNKDKLPSNMFSQSYKPLIEAFDKATPVIGDKAKKLFEDFAKECDIIYKEKQEAFDIQHEKLKEQYRSGAIDWKKYNSLFKKLQKEVNEEADNKRRALFGGGVSGLQDIYDAVSKGTFRDTGQVTYGHGSAYYTDRRRTNPNCSESLANYASLCVGHPELIDILAEDYPKIVTALRGCVEAMLKEVPK